MTTEAPAALEVRGLSKHFGGVRAVENCSFTAPEGKVTGLIGPNGAGKSTAIDLISGFKLPDAGTVIFGGKALEGLPPHRISRLGLIRTFQTPREWPRLTVLENVVLARWDQARETFWRGVLGLRQGQHEATIGELAEAREILEEFGLMALRNERAGNLSGGQKRLVEFARIRMAKPRLVILEEPMGGVNPVLGERISYDWRRAGLDSRRTAICAYADKLTTCPREVSRTDLQSLLDVGLTLEEAWDVAEVSAMYNLTNRMAMATNMLPNEQYSGQARPV